MVMKFKKIALIALMAVLSISLFSCKKDNERANYAQAVFYLEGGSCQNSYEKVTYLYNMDELEETYIADPNLLKKSDITRQGYTLKGWYKTKTVEADIVTYSDPWDFSKDKMTKEGLVLYACWEKDKLYTYDLYYKNDKDEDVLLGSYSVDQGSVFDDYLDYSVRRGYTLLGLYDEDGNPWDNSFVHPGGEENTSIKVYGRYIEGTYTLVYTKEQLKKITTQSVYLMNDIDMEGETLRFSNTYRGTFEGNNYTISNFKIGYDATKSGIIADINGSNPALNNVYVGLFFKLNNAQIRNVTFDKVIVNFESKLNNIENVYLTTLASESTNSKIENVKFNCTFEISSSTLSK